MSQTPPPLTLRHDNGLVFGSRAYRALVKDYGLKQEYITPYTPEQNGLCERFIRSFKEECAWLHRFQDIREARAVVARYIEHFNTQRPHQALAYRTPREAFLNPNPLPDNPQPCPTIRGALQILTQKRTTKFKV